MRALSRDACELGTFAERIVCCCIPADVKLETDRKLKLSVYVFGEDGNQEQPVLGGFGRVSELGAQGHC